MERAPRGEKVHGAQLHATCEPRMRGREKSAHYYSLRLAPPMCMHSTSVVGCLLFCIIIIIDYYHKSLLW